MKHLMLMLLAVGLTTSVFSQETKQVLIKEGTSTYEVTEPVYETVTRDIKPNTVNFSNKSENKAILVKERSFYYKITAPVYETVVVDVQKADGTATKVIKNILVEPAQKEKVEIPAEYKTITKKDVGNKIQVQVLKEKATVRKVDVPAEYQSI